MPSLLLSLAGLALGAWLLARLPTPRLPDPRRPSPFPPGPFPSVSVVVPARNEARTLPTLLASLAALVPAPHEVLVVDDGSTDDTAAVAAAGGARTISAPPPPTGWLGKPWACHQGAEAATGSHLLFLDADTWLAPDALARLVHEHEQVGGLLSVQPHHHAGRPVESLSALCNVVIMMGIGAFALRPRITPNAAFGPCLLTTAADHQAVGGHAAVRGEVVEDLQLARTYRAHGRPVTCLAGGSTVGFRMYPEGLAQLVEGWSKNLAGGASAANRPAVLGAVLWVMALAATASHGIGGAIALASGRPSAVAVLGVASWALAAAELGWMLHRVGRFRWWASVLFPIPLAAFVAIFLRSLLLTAVRRRVTWRGRSIDLRPGPVP